MRQIFLLLVIAACLAVIPGCASRMVPGGADAARLDTGFAGVMARGVARDVDGGAGREPPASVPRVLIRNAVLTVEVPDVEAALTRIRDLARDTGGYVLSTSMHAISLKVPSDRLDGVIDQIGALGKLTRRSITARDVTAQFHDLDARLRNAIATRQKYTELLAKATTVKDTLAVQTELTKIQELIERLQGRLNLMKSQSALSEVRVSLKVARTPGPLVLAARGIGWVLGKLFWL